MADTPVTPVYAGLAIVGADGADWKDAIAKLPTGTPVILVFAGLAYPPQFFDMVTSAFIYAREHGGKMDGYAYAPTIAPPPAAVKWKLKTTLQKARFYDAPSLTANTVGWLYPGDVVEQIGQMPAAGAPEWIQHSRGWTAAMLLERV